MISSVRSYSPLKKVSTSNDVSGSQSVPKMNRTQSGVGAALGDGAGEVEPGDVGVDRVGVLHAWGACGKTVVRGSVWYGL